MVTQIEPSYRHLNLSVLLYLGSDDGQSIAVGLNLPKGDDGGLARSQSNSSMGFQGNRFSIWSRCDGHEILPKRFVERIGQISALLLRWNRQYFRCHGIRILALDPGCF